MWVKNVTDYKWWLSSMWWYSQSVSSLYFCQRFTHFLLYCGPISEQFSSKHWPEFAAVILTKVTNKINDLNSHEVSSNEIRKYTAKFKLNQILQHSASVMNLQFLSKHWRKFAAVITKISEEVMECTVKFTWREQCSSASSHCIKFYNILHRLGICICFNLFSRLAPNLLLLFFLVINEVTDCTTIFTWI